MQNSLVQRSSFAPREHLGCELASDPYAHVRCAEEVWFPKNSVGILARECREQRDLCGDASVAAPRACSGLAPLIVENGAKDRATMSCDSDSAEASHCRSW